MNTLTSRRAILMSLLANDQPIDQLRAALTQFEWDCPEPLVTMTRYHVLNILRKFLAGELRAEAIEAWADLVEIRDDINFTDDRVLDAIFVLANPVSNGELDRRLAEHLVSKISD